MDDQTFLLLYKSMVRPHVEFANINGVHLLWQWITGIYGIIWQLLYALGPVVPIGVSVGTGVARWRR